MRNEVYEGEEEIMEQFRKGYYKSFQAKVFLYHHIGEFDDYVFTQLRFDAEATISVHPHCIDDYTKKIFEKLKVNEWYIFTLFNVHHQQFLNPTILAVNFDIRQRELICAWRPNQLYPGYPRYELPYTYNEWGEPWPE